MFIGIGVGLMRRGKGRKAIKDSFNRADNAATLGRAESGQTWAITGSPWGITGNKAYCTVTNNTSYVTLDASANGTLIADITYSFNEGIVFRYVDLNNHFCARISSTGNFAVLRNDAGTNTTIGSFAFTPVAGQVYNIKIIYNGTSIRAFLDGTERITVTDAAYRQAVRVGFKASDSPAGRFDNFSFTEV